MHNDLGTDISLGAYEFWISNYTLPTNATLNQALPSNRPFQDVFPDIEVPTFKDVLAIAMRLRPDNARETAIAAIRTKADRLHYNPSQIQEISARFRKDPIGTLNFVADHFQHKRVRLDKLLDRDFPLLDDIGYRVREIAVHGAQIPTPPNFISSSYGAQIRNSMRPMHLVTEHNYQTSVDRGEGIIVDLCSYREAMNAMNIPHRLSEHFWRPKPDDDMGRPLSDYSNRSDDLPPVNTPAAYEAILEKFGKIDSPTLPHFIKKFYDIQSIFPNQILYWLKADARRAYHRFRWDPTTSLMYAILLDDDKVYIPITGSFGTTAAPFVYENLRKVIQRQHISRITKLNLRLPSGIMLTDLGDSYVDDDIKCGPKNLLDHELIEIKADIMALGDDAYNEKKEILETRCEILGMLCDNQTKLICLPPRAFFKLIYAFFLSTPPTIAAGITRLPLRLIQQMASLTLHYTQGIYFLRYTAYDFFRMTSRQIKYRNNIVDRKVADAIHLWRAALLTAYRDNYAILTTSYAAVLYNSPPFRHLAHTATTHHIYSDASRTLTTAEMGVFYPDYGWIYLRWPTPDAPSIAALELCAAVLAYMFTLYIHPTCKHIHQFIDNTNAITWMNAKTRTDTPLITNLTIVNAVLQSLNTNCLQTKEYIASADNHVADAISRNKFSCRQELKVLARYKVTATLMGNMIAWSHTSLDAASVMTLLTHTTLASTSFEPF